MVGSTYKRSTGRFILIDNSSSTILTPDKWGRFSTSWKQEHRSATEFKQNQAIDGSAMYHIVEPIKDTLRVRIAVFNGEVS
jgi:hypothetical protein